MRRRRDSTFTAARRDVYKSCSSTLTDRPPRLPSHRRGRAPPRPSPMARSALALVSRRARVAPRSFASDASPSSFAAHAAALRASIARLGLIAPPNLEELLAVLRATGARPSRPPTAEASTRRSYPSRATPTRARTAASWASSSARATSWPRPPPPLASRLNPRRSRSCARAPAASTSSPSPPRSTSTARWCTRTSRRRPPAWTRTRTGLRTTFERTSNVATAPWRPPPARLARRCTSGASSPRRRFPPAPTPSRTAPSASSRR